MAMNSARTPKACLSCRKMKQKCNAFERYPDPCSRCEKKSTQCVIDGVVAAPIRSSWIGTNVKLPRIIETSASPGSTGTASQIPSPSSATHLPNNSVASSGGAPTQIRHHQQDMRSSPGYGTQGGANMKVGSSVPGIDSFVSGTSNGLSDPEGVAPLPFQMRHSHEPPSSLYPPQQVSATRFQPFEQSRSPSQASSQPGVLEQQRDIYFGAKPEEIVPPFKLDEVYSICGTTIHKDRLEKLYTAYFRHYHKIFPILPLDLMSREEPPFFDQQKLLFWAICLVASSVADTDLSAILLLHVRTVLHSRGPYHSWQRPYETLAITYSLTIMCYWSLGTKIIHEEVGWLFNSLAHHLALQADLHHPQHFADLQGSMPESMKIARAKAWVSVVVTNIQLSLGEGYASTVTASGLNPERMFRSFPELSELTKQYKILRVAARATNSLANNPESEFGLSFPETRGILYKTILEVFAQFNVEMSPMDPWTELVCHCAKLCLHTIMLLPDTLERDTKMAIIPLYQTAIEINRLLNSLRQTEETLMASPLFVIRSVLNVAVSLYKILTSSYRSILDEKEVLPLADQLIDHLSHLSPSKNGIHWSLAVATGIRTMFQAGKLSPVLCSVRSRMGSSVMVSCGIELLAWRRSQGKPGFSDFAGRDTKYHQTYTFDSNGTGIDFTHTAPATNGATATEAGAQQPPLSSNRSSKNNIDEVYDVDFPLVDHTWGLWSASPWSYLDILGSYPLLAKDEPAYKNN